MVGRLYSGKQELMPVVNKSNNRIISKFEICSPSQIHLILGEFVRHPNPGYLN